MTLPNNTAAVATAFKALATAQISHEKASDKIITTLRREGVNSAADIAKGGRYIAAFMEGVAQAVLTDAQFKVWADTDLATKANGKLTKRGELMTRVSSRASKVRTAFAKALAAPAEKRGPSERKTFDQVMIVQIDAWLERIAKNKDKDSFNLEADPIEVIAALKAVAKILR
jgi:hypothetical protein